MQDYKQVTFDVIYVSLHHKRHRIARVLIKRIKRRVILCIYVEVGECRCI
jgi:hypothetical protein